MVAYAWVMRLTKLEALKQEPGRLRVARDEGHGVIYGASLATEGEALGHGFELDADTIEQVAEHFEGKLGRWTHGGLSSDGLGSHLGRWKNTRTHEVKIADEDGTLHLRKQALGDFHFTATGHKIQPDGLNVPAAVYLMDRAEEDPSSFGVSIVAEFAMLEERDEEGEVSRRVGRIRSKRAAKRADFVADPAANPIGLHAGLGDMSEVHELAEAQAALLIKRVGPERARERALSLLDRLFPLEEQAENDPPQAEEAETMELTEALAALEAARADLSAKDEQLAAAQEVVTALRAEKQAREAEAIEDYVASLSRRAIEGGAMPIAAERVEKVRERCKADLSAGKDLGEAYLEAALATAVKTTAEPLGDKNPEDKHAALAKAIAAGKPLSAVEA